MNTLSWFHLSDLHFGHIKQLQDQSVMIKTFLHDIVNFQEEHGKADMVFFTGDLVEAGLDEQYEQLKDLFLEPFLEILDLPRERFSFIPGNHDIDRTKIQPIISSGIESLLQQKKEIDLFADPIFERHITTIFGGYQRFIKEFFAYPQQKSVKGFVKTFMVRGARVMVTGLNSALLSNIFSVVTGETNDFGKMMIDSNLIDTAIQPTERDEAAVKFAILHHPLDWLMATRSGERQEKKLVRNFNFVLHGHNEVPLQDAESLRRLNAVVLPSGLGGTLRRNAFGYNHVSYDTNNKRGAIHFRKYQAKKLAWESDTEMGEEGIIDFQLDNERSNEETGPRSSDSRPSKLLVVEDDDRLVPDILYLLGKLGLSSKVAKNREEASKAIASSEEFSLAIIDMFLDEDREAGLKIALEIQAAELNIPVIIVSRFVSGDEVDKIVNTPGVAGFIDRNDSAYLEKLENKLNSM